MRGLQDRDQAVHTHGEITLCAVPLGPTPWRSG